MPSGYNGYGREEAVPDIPVSIFKVGTPSGREEFPPFWSQHAQSKLRPYLVDLAGPVPVRKIVVSGIVHTGCLLALLGRNGCAFSEHRSRSRRPRAYSQACRKSATSHGGRLLLFWVRALRWLSVRI